MTTMPRPTDAQLAAVLRDHVPTAPAGLRDRIIDDVARTPQRRRPPVRLGRLLDPAAPIDRRLLIAATVVLAILAVVAALAIGRQLQTPATPEQLLEQTWVAMADPPAFEMDLETAEGRQYRLLSDGTGRIRFETVTTDAPELDDWYFIAEPGRIGRGDVSMQLWTEEARPDEPGLAEVWLPPELAWRTGAEASSWPPEPACAWQPPTPTIVAGRAAIAMACPGLTITLDTETGLPLASAWVDRDGAPTTLTATTFALAPPPDEAFAFEPSGPEVMDLTEPPPTSVPSIGPVDAAELLRDASAAVEFLPSFTALIRDSQGAQARWYHDGQGTVRLEHFSNRADAASSEAWIAQPGRHVRSEMLPDGSRVIVEYADQPDPRLEFAPRVGGPCDAGVEYVGLAVVAGRAAHHLRSCDSELWIDVETLFTLRSKLPIMGEDGRPADWAILEAVEFEVGPQPAELFDFEAYVGDEPVMTADQFQCLAFPEECVPAEEPEPPLVPLPKPPAAAAPAGVTTDPDAVVAAALAFHAALPELTYEVRDQRIQDSGEGLDGTWRYVVAADGRERSEWDWLVDDDSNPPTIVIDHGDVEYESYDDGNGGIVWVPHRRQTATTERYRHAAGIDQPCIDGWQHLGFATVMDRPAHHLGCAEREYWVDVETGFVLRADAASTFLTGRTWVHEVISLEIGPQPADLFELPPGAVVKSDDP